MKDYTWTFKRFRFPGQTIGVVWHGERIKTITEEPMNPLQELEHSLEASDLDWFDDEFKPPNPWYEEEELMDGES